MYTGSSALTRQAAPASAPSSPGRWRALLTGEDAGQAVAAVEQISRALGEPGAIEPSNFTLSSGHAGCAVLYGYLSAARPGPLAGIASRLFEEAVDALGGSSPEVNFYSGVTGVGWAAEYLLASAPTPREGGDDVNSDVDEMLLHVLSSGPWRKSYDLVSGLVGLGVYALARLPRPAAREALSLILEHLSATAEHTPQGTTWLTSPEWRDGSLRAEFPGGYYNLGVAHGVPGVIGFLAEAYAAGVERASVTPLLEGAMAWLLTQELPPSSLSAFPKVVDRRTASGPAQLAWCYGDPGVAAVLLSAANATGESGWREAALRTALRGARRDPRTARIFDAALCHGAAGVAHLFNRLYQASGEEELGQAALFWFRRVLEMRTPGARFGGFRGYDPLGAGEGGPWRDFPGFLRGAAGIGLALAAATCDQDPTWDQVLIPSLPAAL